MKHFQLSLLIAGALGVASVAGAAQAQQLKGYSFETQNRAQLAVVMRQMEDGSDGAVAGVGGSGTTIVCGGGAATATANNTCIIMNNATGTVVTDQISDGDQTATSSEEVTMNGEKVSGADEVLSTLSQ